MADTPSGQTPAIPDAAPPVTPAADPAVTPPDQSAAPPAKPADSPPAAPEKYDFKALKLPDGISLNEPLLAAVEPIFRKLGLSQEGASELIAEHAKALAKIEADTEAKRESDFKDWMKTQVTQHQAAIRKEWGAAYEANLATAQKGMARVFGPEAKALLDETGLGNHPEFVKAFYAVGKMVSEDIPPSGQLPAAARKADAEVFYGAPN